jgi:DNA repair protein RadC
MTELIADLPPDDRPRERMLRHGAQTLSNAELVAILLGSGMRGKNAIQLARDLLADGFESLRNRETSHLARVSGVGPAKAARVGAAFELARRIASHSADDPPRFEPEILGRQLVSACAGARQERLGAAFLDSRQRIIRQREIFIGTINTALVSTRDIIRCALEENAVGIVLYHNHPSGDPSPSAEDLTFTRRTVEALRLVELTLVDHLVIGAQKFYSMRDRGVL